MKLKEVLERDDASSAGGLVVPSVKKHPLDDCSGVFITSWTSGALSVHEGHDDFTKENLILALGRFQAGEKFIIGSRFQNADFNISRFIFSQGIFIFKPRIINFNNI